MIKVGLRNYRGFTLENAAELEIVPGLISFVGKNNAGKSTCIRALYELRQHFQTYPYWTGSAYQRTELRIQSEPDPTVGESFQSLGHFEPLTSAKNGWAKSQNWRIADCEPPSFFQEHDVGRFLADLPA